jgi:hypothetical protein
MTPIDRAQKAEAILNSPVYQESFDLVRQAIFDKFEVTPVRDTEALVHLRTALKLLNDVKANLTAALNEGKVVEFRLEQAKREPKLSDFRR